MAAEDREDGMSMAAAVPADGGLLLAPGAGEATTLLGFTVRLVYREGRGACAVVEATVPSGSGHPPNHVHYRTEETIYMLAGVVAVQVGQIIHEGWPGALVRVPRGAPHAFWNTGTEPARILSTIVPAGVERFLLELGPRLAASDGTAEQAAAIRRALADQYDVAYAVL